jgi:putative aldouronate transport system permease protein
MSETSAGYVVVRQIRSGGLRTRLIRNKWLYLIMVPGLLYFLVFRYLPIWGVVIAFQNYQPYVGVLRSPWVGFYHFLAFFRNPVFLELLRNTLLLSAYNLVFFFPMPIILALMLNELAGRMFKRVVQTLVYVPHFISMVIVVSITYVLLTTEGGIVNNILQRFTGSKISFLTDPKWFRPLIIVQVIWKETGWGTIIFLAALAGVDPTLYEAAIVDGANRWHRMVHITLPSILSTIVVLLILRMGHVLDNGFEQILLMVNSLNREVGEVFDTYVYRIGITQGAFSHSTAVGLFKSLIGIVLIVTANWAARRAGQASLY